MRYCIKILPQAVEDIRALPVHIRRQIDRKILLLADNPRPHGTKALKGDLAGLYRYRSGDYRIVYQVADKVVTVIIVRIRHRKDVYE
jgi:mRNA interferase RelE/StbE